MDYLLVLGDETEIAPAAEILKREGYGLLCVDDGQRALVQLRRTPYPPVALIPAARLAMVGGSDWLRLAHELAPNLMFVVLAGGATPDGSVCAEAKCLCEMLPQGVTERELLSCVRRGVERFGFLDANALLRQRLVALELAMQRAMDIRRTLERTRQSEPAVKLAGMAIGTFVRPAEGIGGDFLGWYNLPDDRVAIYLGDAAGHDLASAAIADFIRLHLDLLFAAKRWEVLANPAALLSHVSHQLYPIRRIYASMVYLVIDQRTKHVLYSSAGHTPFVCRTGDNRTDLQFSNCPLLGMEENSWYFNRQIYLDHYTHLTLYSDGLVDSRVNLEAGQNQLFDMEALKAFHAYAVNDPRQFAQMIYNRRCQICGTGDHSDDIAVLVIRTGVPYQEQALAEPIPPAPQEREGAVTKLLGLRTDRIGAEYGHDPEQQVYYVVIHGKADLAIANALVPKIEEAIAANTVRLLVMDCMDIVTLDSTFMGSLQELNELCQKRGVTFRVCLGYSEFLDNLKEMYLHDVVNHCTGERYTWSKKLVPVPRLEDLSSRSVSEHLLRTHEILSELSAENREKFAAVIEMLRQELDPSGN